MRKVIQGGKRWQCRQGSDTTRPKWAMMKTYGSKHNPFKASYSLEKPVGQLSEEWTLVHTRMTAYLVIQKIIMMK